MADLIAREDYALSIGGGGCSSYAANRGVTKARANSMGAAVSGSYASNQLIPQVALYKACSCDQACVGYGCACNAECKGYALACNQECGGYWCSCNGDNCPSYCSGNSYNCTSHCDGYSACVGNGTCTNCSNKGWCSSHCFTKYFCSCDNVCNFVMAGYCGMDFGCSLVAVCGSICQCNGSHCGCDTQTQWGGSCTNHCTCNTVCNGNTNSSGCLSDCSSQQTSCSNCKCVGDKCPTYCGSQCYNCYSHCDGYGGAGCSCWGNNRYTCTCWNEARYGCECWNKSVY